MPLKYPQLVKGPSPAIDIKREAVDILILFCLYKVAVVGELIQNK